MGAADADDAAVVSPVVLAQRKRRAHAQQKPPAVTPRGGAMTWEQRNNSLEDLRKQLRQRPARIRDAPTTPPEESRTVRRALAAQRALAVDSLAAECAARLALATNEDYSENPLNKYAHLEESLANLKRALQDAAKAVEAEEAAIEGEARTLHEVEADMRACTRRLLAGDYDGRSQARSARPGIGLPRLEASKRRRAQRALGSAGGPGERALFGADAAVGAAGRVQQFHQGPQKVVRLGPARQRRRIPKTRAARLPHAGFVVRARFREKSCLACTRPT